MKIKRSQGTGQTSSADKAKKGAESSALDFRHLLQAQMEGGIQGVDSTAAVSNVQEREQGSAELRLQGVQLTEATIESLWKPLPRPSRMPA